MPAPQPPARRRYRGRTPEQLRAERRERLLEAALELFGTRGYANTPIETICATARVATRHFYEQFEGREALLSAVFDSIMLRAGELIDQQLSDDSAELSQRVVRSIQAIMIYLLEDTRRGRVVSLETVGVSAQMEQHRRDKLHAVADLVVQFADSLAEQGELPQRDYHLPAVGLVGLFVELVVEYLVKDTGLSAEEMAREAVILFRAMVIGAQNYEAQ